jgi:glycosyltransferase involved in cell wall biosynthesis
MNSVSVVVPCYNQAKYLDLCLNSILKQTYNNWECIIINDGSTDNTIEIAKSWITKDNRFRLINQINKGLSKARNIGIKSAKGEFILPLDSDDYISDNYIEECITSFNQNKTIKLVYGKGEKFGAENGPWTLQNYSFKKLLNSNMIFCAGMFRKADWFLTGGYDESLLNGWEDWEFWINLLKDGGNVEQSNNCTFYYRIKNDSMVKSLEDNRIEKVRIKEYVFHKHFRSYTNFTFYELYSKYNELKQSNQKFKRCITIIQMLRISFKKSFNKLKF